MEKTMRIFNSPQEADEEEYKYYASLTPDSRVEVLLNLISNYASTYYDGFTERLQRVHRIIDREEC